MSAISIVSEGHYYRGNLHGHSTFSDGHDSPEEVIRLYRQAGYDFTCLSEHYWSSNRFCAQSLIDMQDHNSDDFITILSAELHCHGKRYDRDGLWHILANGLPADFPMASDDETGPQLVRRAVDAGAFVSIPHPEWYTLGDDEALSLAAAGAHGVEIYNHSSAIAVARGGGTATIDMLHHEGHRVHILATDDSHHIVEDGCGGWVMVRAASLNPASIITALKAGDFYASCGPEFAAVTLRDGSVDVTCSAVQRVILAADNHRGDCVHGDGLTSASFNLGDDLPAFLRIIIIDAQGRPAWTNAVWLDQTF